MDELTVNESLEFFANIKGVPHKEKEFQIGFIQKSLNLVAYSKVRANTLSGGNKRKLCTALTLLTCPKLAYFDEPTVGLDPVSRRNLLNLIK